MNIKIRNKIIYGILIILWVAIGIMIGAAKVPEWQFWIAICALFATNNTIKLFNLDLFEPFRGKYHIPQICSILGILLLFVYMATHIVYFAIASILIGFFGLGCMDKEKYIK